MTKSDLTVFANDALARLRGNSEGLPWAERRDIAAMLGRLLPMASPSEPALALAFLLAGDIKPEVRKEIAEAMVHLPDETFTKLAVLLGEDSNAFVKKAAERAIARRRRSAREQQQTRRKLGSVDSRMASFEEVYGPAAMKEARRIADEQYSALVQQTHHNIPNILSPVKTSITTLLKQFEKNKPDARFCVESLREMGRRLEYLERFLGDMKEYAKAKVAPEKRRERVVELIREAQEMSASALRAAGTPISRISVSVGVPESLAVYVARHQVVMAMVHVIAPIEKSRKPNGTGFGIATAAGYVEAQGGSLALDSVQGEGFAVTMTLPIESEDEE